MKSSCKIISVLFLSFVLISCSAPKKTVVQQAPVIIQKERIVSKSFDAVWQTAIEWFATHNTPIKNLDKSSGLISTEYSVSIGDAIKYMNCGSGNSNFSGKVEVTNKTGNFNVIIKRLGDNSTKINVNVFFGGTVNKYRYKSLLSTEYVLESSTAITCTSTGNLEKEILDYLEAGIR
jgi:hypothetical protein